MTEEVIVRKKKKRRKKNYLLRLLVMIAIIAGIIYFVRSPFFDVQTIEVAENSYFTSEQIIERAGITQGQNILFEVKTAKVKEGLLEDPYIRNVQVKKSLPNKVVLTVEERKEAVAIPYSDEYILIDPEGLVLRMTEVEPKLPLLVGLTIKAMDVGTALEVEENSVLNDTLIMIQAIEKSDIYFKKIDISKVMIRAYVYDNLVCQGMAGDITARVSDGNLQKIMYELYQQGIERGTVTVTSDPTNIAFSPDFK